MPADGFVDLLELAQGDAQHGQHLLRFLASERPGPGGEHDDGPPHPLDAFGRGRRVHTAEPIRTYVRLPEAAYCGWTRTVMRPLSKMQSLAWVPSRHIALTLMLPVTVPVSR